MSRASEIELKQNTTVDKSLYVTGLNDKPKLPHAIAQENLENYVENIDNQFSSVLNRHEEDFVNAYRVRNTFSYLLGPHDESIKGANISEK